LSIRNGHALSAGIAVSVIPTRADATHSLTDNRKIEEDR